MPTWFARRVLDVAGKLSDAYYRLKYGTMARRLGRSTVSPDDRRGFIVLQIDGLSHRDLRQALEEDAMPYVNRQLSSGHLSLGSWRCGVPSSTPAVQAGMMFGSRFDIPGFRWYEKDRGTLVTPQRVDQMSAVHNRISKGQPGILSGGSCYVSMFDGDADLALFTLGTLRRQRFFESLRGVGLLILFLLSPLRVLRVLGLAAADYVVRVARRLSATARSLGRQIRRRLLPHPSPTQGAAGVLNPLDVFSPLLHAVTDALFTEVQTFGVMLDIYRCVPAIYANYNGYDEVAHEMGPNHPAAFRVLRRIDRRIHQIDRMRSNYRKRQYDLYLISDHGNTPAIPFSWQNESTLGRHLVAAIGEPVSVEEHIQQHTHGGERARYLREELHALEDRAPRRFRNLLTAARRYVDRHLPETEDLDYDLERQQDVVVSASGSLAHVYFNVSNRPLDMIEVLILYPRLLDHLADTHGIGAIIGRADERTVVLGSEGGTLDIGSEARVVEPPNPLSPFGDPVYAARQLHRLAHFPHAGDLILLGAADSNGTVVTFESQAATHGGLGGPQTYPFIAWPSGLELEPGDFQDAEDLYPFFRRYHG